MPNIGKLTLDRCGQDREKTQAPTTEQKNTMSYVLLL